LSAVFGGNFGGGTLPNDRWSTAPSFFGKVPRRRAPYGLLKVGRAAEGPYQKRTVFALSSLRWPDTTTACAALPHLLNGHNERIWLWDGPFLGLRRACQRATSPSYIICGLQPRRQRRWTGLLIRHALALIGRISANILLTKYARVLNQQIPAKLSVIPL
jgi:hypothetical protein